MEKDEKAWIVRENDKQQNPTPYADYPNPDAKAVTFSLKAGGPGYGSINFGLEPKERGKGNIVR